MARLSALLEYLFSLIICVENLIFATKAPKNAIPRIQGRIWGGKKVFLKLGGGVGGEFTLS